MKYFALDIETTGLDVFKDQILEVGCIYDDSVSDIESLKRFHCYIYSGDGRYSGHPIALAMNAEHLLKIHRRDAGYLYLHRDSVASAMYDFIYENPIRSGLVSREAHCGISPGTRITFAGKNIGKLDYWMLKAQCPRFEDLIKFHHRFIEVGSLFLTGDDTSVPDMAECKKRVGLSGDVAHNAISDCLDVIRCVRFKLRTGSI